MSKRQRRWLIAGILLFVGFLLLPSSFDEEPVSTVVESVDGYLLGAKIAADGQWRFPASGTLPDKYAKALVAFEDRRFYYHPGIDPLSVGRALWVNIRKGKIVEGGSTISMQVVRLMRKGKPRTVFEKMIEAVLALRLEFRYSKKEILALYARHAPFGGNVVGIDAAAWRYFGRPAADLSWAEAAMLAVLPNTPSLIHPGRNRERLLNKRNALLHQLCAKGYFSADDLPLYCEEALPDKPLPLPSDAPHLLERLAQTNFCTNIRTNNCTNIRTTVLYHLQQRAVEVVNRHAMQQSGNNVNNMAAIILENETDRMLAYVGNVTGRADNEQGEKVDIITAPRSTGSILKPFLFAAMLDEGTLLPSMLLPDIPVYINGFAPQNYSKSFDGAVEAHVALERSLNIPAVLLLQDYGLERFHALLCEMGFSTIVYEPSHYGLSLILGGAEVNLLDVSNAYAAMARVVSRFAARSGQYSKADWQKPFTMLKDTSSRQPRNYKLTPDAVISAAACWQVLNSLSEVNRPEGEEEWRRFPSSRKVAWKTGTSYGNRDAWAVGTTPDYTVGVWVGNASGEGRPMLTGVAAAAPVLFDLFNLLPPTGWFRQPYDEMTQVTVCRQSGHRTNNLCPDADTLWILNTAMESRPCPYHIQVHLDRTGKHRVTSECEEPYRMITQPWFVLPPAQEYFYKTKHHSYRQLPPVHPGCLQSAGQRSMELLYPQNGFRIVLTKQLDGSIGRLILQAVHRRSTAIIYWHLNKEYIGSTTGQHQLPLIPSAGQHVLTLVDDEGNSISGNFIVEE